MNIKDVLLGLTTYPKSSNIDAIRWAVSFADLMNCRIAAFAADVKIEVPGSLLGNALMNISALAGAEMKKNKENARSLLAVFTEEAAKRGVPHETIHEHCLVGVVPDLIADCARLRDLTIVPVPADNDVDQWYAETVVFQSGRPVLIVPEDLPHTEAKLDAIAIAWDFSRTAARAVADAIPLLERAKTVRILARPTKSHSTLLVPTPNWPRIYRGMGSALSSKKSMPQGEHRRRHDAICRSQ